MTCTCGAVGAMSLPTQSIHSDVMVLILLFLLDWPVAHADSSGRALPAMPLLGGCAVLQGRLHHTSDSGRNFACRRTRRSESRKMGTAQRSQASDRRSYRPAFACTDFEIRDRSFATFGLRLWRRTFAC